MSTFEQGYSGADRRRFPRVNAMVEYEIIDKELNKKSSNTKNIGAGGIAFFSHENIKANNILSLFVSLPDATNFQAKAQVVWCDSVEVSWDPQIHYECGVKFIEIDEESRQKISKYVFLRLNVN